MGAAIIFGRRPILGLIGAVSSRLIPEEYSAGELKYLEVYAETIQDMVLTERERNLLATLATAYEIDEDRRAAIEKNYRDSQSLGPAEAIKIVGSL